MMKKPIAITVLVLLLGLGAAAAAVALRKKGDPPPPPAATAAYTDVALLVSNDKRVSPYVRSAEEGANAAAAEINRAGGVKGRHLRITPINTDGNSGNPLGTPESKPLFVLDALSVTTQGSLVWAQDLEIPLFYLLDGTCRTVSKNAKEPARSAWNLGLTWQSTVEPLLIYLSERFSRDEKQFSAIFIAGDTPDSVSLSEYARATSEALGFKTVDNLKYDVRIADYYSVIRNILAQGADILFIANPGSAGNLFIEQASKLGVSKEIAITGIHTFDPELTGALGPALNGDITVGRYVPSLDTPGNKNFLAALPGGVTPTPVAAAAYTAVHMAARAFNKTSSNDLSAFAGELSGMSFESPNGAVRMNPTNHVLEQEMLILEAKDGRWTVANKVGTAVHPRLEGCGDGQ